MAFTTHSGYGASYLNTSSTAVGLLDTFAISDKVSSSAEEHRHSYGGIIGNGTATMLLLLLMDTTNESSKMDTADILNITYDDVISTCSPPSNGSDAANDLFLFVTYGLLTTFIGLMGMAGNILSIIVLSRPQMKSSINCCLIGLAVFDLLVMVSSTLMFGIHHLTMYTETFLAYNEIIYPHIIPHLIYPIGMIAQTGSVWVTVTVTIERYVAVCLPLKAKYLCTYGRARMYILIIVLFSVLYNLPRFWEVQRCFVYFYQTNVTHYVVQPSELRINDIYVKIYITWLYIFVLYFVPFVILAVLNVIIWFKVREANRERQKLSRLQQKEMGLAIMLFCVVIVFFICNLLALLINILEMTGTIIDELTASSNLLVTMNSSVNFIIYCIFGQKFRRILLRTVCSCLPKHLRRGHFSRASEMDESTCYTAETTLLVHYNGHPVGGVPHSGNVGFHSRNSGLGLDRVSRSPSTGVSFKIDSNRSTPSPIQRSNSHLGYLNIEFRPSSSSSSSLSAERSNSISTASKSHKMARRHSSRLSLRWNSSNTALQTTN